MKYLLLPVCLLSTTAVQAQVIADPAQATAARDTLLHAADTFWQFVQQHSPLFQTNVQTSFRRRVVVTGQLLANSTSALEQLPLRWRQVTRYRRNGRVQQRGQITFNGRLFLQQERLNGQTVWLLLNHPLSSTVQGKFPRHLGRYLSSGFVTLDQKQYALPRTEQP